MKKLWTLLFLLAVVFAGCNKTDDLWDEVHDIQKRLTKLEVQVNNLNGNITALQELYKNGATITTVEEANGTYTITLSNGKVLKVVQKMEETVYPIVGIDNEGYWTVSYGNETPKRILVNNNPVKATGEDGLTPEFRINEKTGYWEIRYKATEAFTTVKDSNGNPVKAEGTSATGFFQSAGISEDGKSFNLVLKDDTKITVPIVGSFSCTFEESVVGVQKFNSKESKDFKVLLNGVDDIALMACPAGWSATLSEPLNNEAILTVTAPEALATPTRATANNGTDISILANSGKFSTILKLQVEVIPGEPIEPTIDYLSIYQKGETLFTIGDGTSAIEINSANFPESQEIDLSEADQTLAKTILAPSQPTIYFLSGEHVLNITMDGDQAMNGKKVVFISKSAAAKPSIKFVGTAGIRLQQNSSIVFKNVTIENLSLGNYSSTGNAHNIWIEDCNIQALAKPILALTGTNAPLGGVNSLYFRNNYIEMNTFPDKSSIFSMGPLITTDVTNVSIENNIWYKKGTLVQGSIYTSNSKGITKSISFSNNTIINYAGNSSNSLAAAYLILTNVENVNIKNNIGYSDDNATDGFSNSGSSFYIIANIDPMPSISVTGNIVYGLNPDLANKWKWNTYGWKTNASTKVDQDGEKGGIITRYSKNPFANPNGFGSGNFTPISELDGKGANLK